MESLLVWHETTGFAEEPERGGLAVADSWLLRDGRVRGYELHWARFMQAVTARSVDVNELVTFRRAVTRTLPRAGAWFPRIELSAGASPQLRLRLRPAPPLHRTARVWVTDLADPRVQPSIKGPDFPALQRLRAQAGEHGADEAILLDEHGRAVEGAFSNLFWWDDDKLCTAPDDGRILPGVTRRLLIDRASEEGVAVCYAIARPSQLVLRETWITSALHGIRAVTRWIGHAVQPPTARVNAWRTWLAARADLLPPP